MSENAEKRKRGRRKLTDGTRWNDREMMDFAGALQRYGSGDTKNIALAVKTKSENDVKALIKLEVNKARSKLYKGTGQRRQDIRTVRPDQKTAEGWTAARKWQKIAQNQMPHSLRSSEYSGLLMTQLWEQFRDEQPPPENPEVIDVRSIYAYVVECMKGERPPPELPPKESAIVLMLLRLMREMCNETDMHEEQDFIRNFKEATKFMPFEVKDEFRKKGDKDAVVCDPECVPIPEEVYLGLNRHRKLVQSLNPLSVPLWLLEKEQDFLARMFDDATPQSDDDTPQSDDATPQSGDDTPQSDNDTPQSDYATSKV